MGVRLHAPAAERNAGPILAVLRTVLPTQGQVLEVASGTGQHVAAFAEALDSLRFLPTDLSPERFDSVRAWTEGLSNVAEPRVLDVTQPAWPVDAADAVLCANMIHIAPPEATPGLMRGAARVLPTGAPLVLYGPFRVDGAHTAPSNEAFDVSLKARDPRWGVRDLAWVDRHATEAGLQRARRIEMPANNLILVFRRLPTP